MQIQILNATIVEKPTKVPGKTYKALDLAYKNLTFQGKVEGKMLVSFGAGKPAYDVLSTAQPGEVYEVDAQKNESTGYKDWLSATKGVGGAVPASPGRSAAGSPNVGNSSGYTATKSTYATPEERAQTQLYIVRQSNINSAIASLVVGAKAPPAIEDILKRAKEFEAHVFGDSKEEVDKGPEGFKDLEGDGFDDIPM